MNDALAIGAATVVVALLSVLRPMINPVMGSIQRAFFLFSAALLTGTLCFWTFAVGTNDPLLRMQLDKIGWALLVGCAAGNLIGARLFLRLVYAGENLEEKRYAWADYRDTGHMRGRIQAFQKKRSAIFAHLKRWWMS